MKIQALVENVSRNPLLKGQDGLSIYIETQKHKVLFDMGENSLFIENAQKLGIDIRQIDIAVISHGHYDHGGGLKYFLDVNDRAKIYMSSKAFGDYYTIREGKHFYAGLDKTFADNDRIVFVDGDFRIDDEIKLYSDISSCETMKLQNKDLLERKNGAYVDDEFDHEQNIVIREGGKTVLIAGCAHKGIVNIINHVAQEESIDYVIGGFHLKHIEDYSFIKNTIASDLAGFKCRYYTCHCTGVDKFSILKDTLKDSIDYMSAGDSVSI